MASIQGIGDGHGTFSGRLTDALDGLSKWRRQRRVYRDTVRELKALNGRELADLGLNSSLINRTALDAAARA